MLSVIGDDYLRQGNLEKAIENYKLHFSIAAAVEDRVGEAIARFKLGKVFITLSMTCANLSTFINPMYNCLIISEIAFNPKTNGKSTC